MTKTITTKEALAYHTKETKIIPDKTRAHNVIKRNFIDPYDFSMEEPIASNEDMFINICMMPP